MAEVELSAKSLLTSRQLEVEEESDTVNITQRDDIETNSGIIHVCVQGERGKPAILTYHDIGLNSSTCWDGFFAFEEMRVLLKHFTVYHVNAPGHEDGAKALTYKNKPIIIKDDQQSLDTSQCSSSLDTSYSTPLHPISGSGLISGVSAGDYPTMDELAGSLLPVMQYYGLRYVIGFGSGAGANVLSRFALNHPDKVEALVLLNGTSGQASWTEWGQQKWHSWYLKSGQLTPGAEEYLLNHWFGSTTMRENPDLCNTFACFIKRINPVNLGHFITSYSKRTDLLLEREMNPDKKNTVRQFRCPVMLITGDYSPHLQETIDMNSEMDPSNAQWIKFEAGGMIHEEVPHKLAEAFRLFLQGMGYVPTLRGTIIAPKKTAHSTHMMANECEFVVEKQDNDLILRPTANYNATGEDFEIEFKPQGQTSF